MGLPDLSSVRDSTDQLVDNVECYNSRPLFLHGYIAPFVVAYAMLYYVWITRFFHDSAVTDIYFITIAILIFVQVLVYLSSLWSVHCLCFLAFNKAPNAINASFVKVVPTPNNGSAELISLHHSTSEKQEEQIWFVFQKTKFTFDYKSSGFVQVVYATERPLQEYREWRGYTTDEEVGRVEKFYGKNNLEMDIPEFWPLFRERATAPFFVFQVFCVALWCLDEFWYYSLFTLFMLVAFESILVQQQLRNLAEIRKMGNKPFPILVFRNRKWRSILCSELVPGDIVSIGRSQDNMVPCDLILLRGSCIVDESMLTGESVPQMKEPIETVTEKRNFDIDNDGKLHLLYGGTKILQHTPPAKNSTAIRAADNGCVGYVLRTGFNTSQGKLLRTILYGVKRVTANNLETFAFIMFLLVFAVAAAAYVWIKSSEDPKRNRYKLVLECALILTTVVPPELPIELSLAVNSSLTSLIKLYIFCTEPFRIPFAGKVDFCCFDKTGTLTSNNLVVEGIAGLKENDSTAVIPVAEAPVSTIQVLATCHSLVQLEDGLVGDPLEKATLTAIDWTLTKADVVIPHKSKVAGMKIFHRNYFSSSLKRMSVVAGYNIAGSAETHYFAAIKGAPEILRPMFANIPNNYDDVYLTMSRKGTRVLALGRRDLGTLSTQQLRELSRDDLEKNLEFAGFIIISCPLKPDSKMVMKELINSSHYVTMITGDAPLTACHVAKELYFICKKKETLILMIEPKTSLLQWSSIDEQIRLDLIPENESNFFSTYELCMTGDSLNRVLDLNPKFFFSLLPHVRVFARVTPKQKEVIVTTLRSLGFHTLMCGDGTNDVGALKHAHVGVALISNYTPPVPRTEKEKEAEKEKPPAIESLPKRRSPANTAINKHRRFANQSPAGNSQQQLATGPNARQQKLQEQMRKILSDLEEEEKMQIVKLGDASIAAPFTSKLSSIQCICHIIRQGRCTLVTTLQMFKILALNALILAYCQSVLYLDGIKFSDSQATLQGLFLTGCFLFITRSKPLDVLSKRRPLPNIFNVYTILTVLLQFVIHFVTLVYLVQQAMILDPRPEDVDLEKEFAPSLLNSTVYIISISLQVSTFAVNYKGHPFMCSLKENKPLFYSIVGSFLLVFVLVTGVMPEFSQNFSVVEFPAEFQVTVLGALSLDLTLAVMVDRVCEYLFGDAPLMPI